MGNGVKMTVFVRWLAHAGFQIMTDGKAIYVDLENNCNASEKADLMHACR